MERGRKKSGEKDPHSSQNNRFMKALPELAMPCSRRVVVTEPRIKREHKVATGNSFDF
jgi:hypothetical protein